MFCLFLGKLITQNMSMYREAERESVNINVQKGKEKKTSYEF